MAKIEGVIIGNTIHLSTGHMLAPVPPTDLSDIDALGGIRRPATIPSVDLAITPYDPTDLHIHTLIWNPDLSVDDVKGF